MSRYKQEIVKMTVEAAVDEFYSGVESLASELREIVDNATDGLSQTQRIQTLDETASALEELYRPEISTAAIDLVNSNEISVGVSVLGGKLRGRESRQARASNLSSHAQVAIEEIRD